VVSGSQTVAALQALSLSFRAAPVQALSIGLMTGVVGNTAVLVVFRSDELTFHGIFGRALLFLLALGGRSCPVGWPELVRTSRVVRAVTRGGRPT
jgi:hypothetical protein